MRLFTALRLVPVLALIAGTADAQTDFHGFLQGGVGATFGSQTSASYGGEVGIDVNSALQVVVDVTYMSNIINSTLSSEVVSAIGSYVPPGGQPASVIHEAGYSYMAGVRYLVARGPVAPYLQGTAGVMQLSLQIQDANGNDTTERYTASSLNTNGTTTTAPLGGSFVGAGDISALKFVAGVAAGIEVPVASRLRLDIGYAYSRPFGTTTNFNISRVYGALAFRF